MSLKTVAEAWVQGWSQPDSAAFAKLFDDAIIYEDTAFGVRRTSPAGVQEHHQIWLASIPDFSVELEQMHEVGNTVIVQGVGRGTFNGVDLPGGRMKATGKPFEGRLAAVIVCGENGIVECTEYYDRLFMPGLPAE